MERTEKYEDLNVDNVEVIGRYLREGCFAVDQIIDRIDGKVYVFPEVSLLDVTTGLNRVDIPHIYATIVNDAFLEVDTAHSGLRLPHVFSKGDVTFVDTDYSTVTTILNDLVKSCERFKGVSGDEINFIEPKNTIGRI